MKFQAKIIIVTLTILISTLILNSVLSLASFEKIYVSSLVSTYELTGKNLKRKIEQALRFGKPLDMFKGMDMLLSEIVEKNPDISYVGIGNPDGLILYHTVPEKIGTSFDYPVPAFLKDKQSDTRLHKGMYVTFLPLYDRSRELSGVISLSFSREVVYQKLKMMASENIKTLWILILFTALSLIFFLAMLIVRPVRQEVLEISEMLIWPGEIEDKRKYLLYTARTMNGEPFPINGDFTDTVSLLPLQKSRFLDTERIRDELDRLGWHVYSFVGHTFDILSDIETLTEMQQELFDDAEKIKTAISEFQQIIENPEQKKLSDLFGIDLECLQLENRNIADMLELFQRITHILQADTREFVEYSESTSEQ